MVSFYFCFKIDITEKQIRVSRGAIPSFADFVNFVNAEAGIATDPVFSCSGKSKTSRGRAPDPYYISNYTTGISLTGRFC